MLLILQINYKKVFLQKLRLLVAQKKLHYLVQTHQQAKTRQLLQFQKQIRDCLVKTNNKIKRVESLFLEEEIKLNQLKVHYSEVK